MPRRRIGDFPHRLRSGSRTAGRCRPERSTTPRRPTPHRADAAPSRRSRPGSGSDRRSRPVSHHLAQQVARGRQVQPRADLDAVAEIVGQQEPAARRIDRAADPRPAGRCRSRPEARAARSSEASVSVARLITRPMRPLPGARRGGRPTWTKFGSCKLWHGHQQGRGERAGSVHIALTGRRLDALGCLPLIRCLSMLFRRECRRRAGALAPAGRRPRQRAPDERSAIGTNRSDSAAP